MLNNLRFVYPFNLKGTVAAVAKSDVTREDAVG